MTADYRRSIGPNLGPRAPRLREHYRETLRAEVADTLGPGEDPDAELRLLMSVN